MKKKILFTIIMSFFTLSLTAQFFEVSNTNPPGIKWKKIDTPHYEIIFPLELTKEGQRVANTLEHIYKALAKTLEKEPRRITLVLTNQGVTSNGYVAFAPRMSEWFSVPTRTHLTGVSDWYDLLAVHEGRHIVQLDKLNQGFTKTAGLAFGDIGRMVFSILSTPYWFLEGDAVGIETALTNGGRGRQPAFDMDIRALLLSGTRYSYYKAYFGSYKDWYPNYYHLGYLLTTHAKRKYGSEKWSKILDRASQSSFSPFTFSEALKKETGKTVVGLYEEAMDELEALWNNQLDGASFTEFRTINSEPRKVWTNYVFPRYDTGGTVYAQKIGLENPLMLVRLHPGGKEEKIKQFSPLSGFYNRLSIANGKAAWNEYIPDPRWGKRSYSSLVIHDFKTGKTRRIAQKSKLFDPALSPDGKRVITVEFSPELQCQLVILDASTGKEMKRLANPSNDFINSPSWSEDGTQIVFTRQNREGRALSIANIENNESQDIIPFGWENITYPVFYNNYVLYDSPYSGIDNIYAIDAHKRTRYQVTSSKYGAFFPEVSPDREKLLFSNYTINGYDAAEMPLKPSSWKRIEDIEDRSLDYYEPLINQEQGGSVFDDKDIPNHKYEVKNYSPAAHILNVHSWVPVPILPDIGLFLVSNDKLNTASLMGGIKYNANEKVFGFELFGSYAGFFPVLDFGISYGGRSSTYTNEKNVETRYSWRETSAVLGFRFPLNLSRGIYNTSLILESNISFTEISNQTYTEPYENGNGQLFPVSYRLSFSRFRKSSMRDLKPSWGQYFKLAYRHTPWKSDYKGSLLSARIGLYFPGLSSHHSLLLQGGYEKQKPGNYHFPDEILFPRGYDYIYYDTIFKASVNYAFPLAYPDLALGSLLYLKRLKTNLFYDHGIGQNRSGDTHYQSIGIELTADIYLLSIPVMLDIGSRVVYRIKDKDILAEPLIFGFSF